MELGFIVTIFLIGFVGSYISTFLIDPPTCSSECVVLIMLSETLIKR